MFDRIRASLWDGFDAARASARAKAQPSPLASALEAFFSSEPFKSAIASIIKGAFEDGVAAEKARVSAILTAPGAAHFLEIAVDLVRGPATGAQAIQVLARAEADAATRAALLKSSPLESATATTFH
jgi:hypothetical protein